mgnify:CR=1 FL=1
MSDRIREVRDKGVVWSGEFDTYHQSVPPLLDATSLLAELAPHQRVLILSLIHI